MTVVSFSECTVKTEDNEENKASSKRNPETSFPLFASVSPIRFIRVRLQNCRGPLAGGALADKIGFLWLNTELRGCRVTVLGTM